jgi:hypothetical protein
MGCQRAIRVGQHTHTHTHEIFFEATKNAKMQIIYIYYLLLVATMSKTKEGDGRKGRRASPFFLLTTREVVCYSNVMPQQRKLDVTMMKTQHLK